MASFLVKDLHLDWRLGAEWFESLLLDHDVCSNYGNWNYVAGTFLELLTVLVVKKKAIIATFLIKVLEMIQEKIGNST